MSVRSRVFRRALLASAATLLAAQAAGAAEKNEEIASNEVVTVTAVRTAKDVNAVPATVTVIDDKRIADGMIRNIKDLIRFEPGVSVRAQPSRFGAALGSTGRDGNAGFNIRGLEGNRVLLQVDGIRIPDGYGYGPQAVGRGDFVDLDLLKSVEIVRGPASALYGSDGLAGSVSFVTKDPVDFLKGDKDWHVQAHAGYASADESWSTGGVLAGAAGAWSAMVAYTHRDWRETENRGTVFTANSTRTAPNPEDGVSDSVLAKLVWTPNEAHRLRLTYDRLDSTTDWDVLTARAAVVSSPTSVLQLLAHDETARDRVTLDHRYDGTGVIRSASTNIYYQDSTTRQFTFEDRNTAADRTRDNTFDNRVWGFGTVLESEFDTGAITHRLVYGVDVSKTHQDSIRGGTVATPPDFLPSRAFPTTDYTLAGIFVQDEIRLLDGALTLYPALRFDYYDLDPVTGDPLYPDVAVGSSDSHWSPKLGVMWNVSDTVRLFANVATGFKAPAPSQVNNYFSNPAFGYTSVPNPDLKPETSRSIEAGVRYIVPGFTLSLAAFYGTYEDFISQQVVGGTGAPGDPLVFQYVNLGSVEIHGVEGKVEGDLGAGFSAVASFSWQEGDDTTGATDVPLSTIDPVKVSAALNWRDEGGRFGAQLAAVYSSRKRASETACAPTCFRPPSFAVLDLTAWVEITEGVRLRGGVFNITDEKYWWWSDVQGLSQSSLLLDSYTQPGRNYAVSLTLDF